MGMESYWNTALVFRFLLGVNQKDNFLLNLKQDRGRMLKRAKCGDNLCPSPVGTGALDE